MRLKTVAVTVISDKISASLFLPPIQSAALVRAILDSSRRDRFVDFGPTPKIPPNVDGVRFAA